MKINIRKPKPDEYGTLCALILNVFAKFVAPDYSKEGINFFKSISKPEDMKKRVEAGNIVLVAEKKGKIIGVIEGRDGSHIARFFVDELHQRQGVGRFLFDALIDEFRNEGNKPDCITVNSSPCAVKAYESLGFHKTGEEEIGNGMRFTPMSFQMGL